MSDCLFCKIIAGDIPSAKVYEDELVLAFRDIAPQAPTHILVIPKAHIASVADISGDSSAVVAHIFEIIPQIARAEGLDSGYRVVSNCGEDAGQTVHHLHFHILGGQKLALQMA
ncbi:MAG: histidine triad nucleotide-binding protein [Oscillospiraceae bacterium]|nr:histidine triad nucleotide-binding protein [Oscillospiraceae bacterium]